MNPTNLEDFIRRMVVHANYTRPTKADLLEAALRSLPHRNPRDDQHFTRIFLEVGGPGTIAEAPTPDHGWLIRFTDGSFFDSEAYAQRLKRPN